MVNSKGMQVNQLSGDTVERIQQFLTKQRADMQAKQAAKRAMSGGVAIGGSAGGRVDRVEVLTDPAKFHAAMMLQAVDANGSLDLSRDEIEQAIKYQAQRAQLGDLSFVLESLVGNLMQLTISAAKMRTMSETAGNTDKAADMLQRSARIQADAVKVACSIAGIVRSSQSD